MCYLWTNSFSVIIAKGSKYKFLKVMFFSQINWGKCTKKLGGRDRLISKGSHW